MTVASEISRLQTAKQGIIESIRNKGIVVPDAISLSDTPPLIDAISGASGSAGYVITTLWNYIADGDGVIKYGANQNYTLRDSINNYDELVAEVVSEREDETQTTTSTMQHRINIKALKEGKRPSYITLSSYGIRFALAHIYDNKYYIEYSNGTYEGLVSLYGIKYTSKNYLNGIVTKNAVNVNGIYTVKVDNNYRTIVNSPEDFVVTCDEDSLLNIEIMPSSYSVRAKTICGKFPSGAYINNIPHIYEVKDFSCRLYNRNTSVGSVTIQGEPYPVVKIGNSMWIASPLKADFCSNIYSATYNCRYYQRTSIFNSAGLTGEASSFISSVGDGWRFPNKEDIDALYTAIKGNEPYVIGTDDIGIYLDLFGAYYSNGTPCEIGTTCWTCGIDSNFKTYAIAFTKSTNSSYILSEATNSFYIPCFLCKDA